jgi:precorrin-8X/cobalt-precorrin-8 methylmutase
MNSIIEQSFAIIDREFGPHSFSPEEYAIVRRIIHSTADFEFKDLIRFSPDAIDKGIAALRGDVPVITDVTMVKQGIVGMLSRNLDQIAIAAIDLAPSATPPGKTRCEVGMLRCLEKFPDAIFVIGNAPTALLALCEQICKTGISPALVIGAPVGFVSVTESKAALAQLSVPQIRIEGRKGGSPVAAAIVNALVVLATQKAGTKTLTRL